MRYYSTYCITVVYDNWPVWYQWDECLKRQEFTTWYDEHKHRIFDNRRVLEEYCQDDGTVLREALTIFRRNFLEIVNIEVFLEAYTIASACKKVLRKKFLKPYKIELIPWRIQLQPEL